MRLFVSGATATLRRYAERCKAELGYLVVPGAKNDPNAIVELGLKMAADNGAFSGLDVKAFVWMLAEYRETEVQLEWVACPDVVCDDIATYRLWGKWEGVIKAFGFRPALVLQDGMDLWGVMDINPPAVFIGGSTEYKLGSEVRRIVKWAGSKGKPVHMGRVNTKQRIEYAIEIGCTSCDGSGFSKWPDIRIPKGIRWIRKAMRPGLIQLAETSNATTH